MHTDEKQEAEIWKAEEELNSETMKPGKEKREDRRSRSPSWLHGFRIQSSPLPAIDRIREVARQKGDDFDAALAEYLREGIVVSNPAAFVMALPIRVDGREAWFVKAAAGDLRLIIRMFPVFKPWVVFDRARGNKRQRVYSAKRILRFFRNY
jgi:hypothetical protein